MALTKIKSQIKVRGDNSKESLGLVHVITGDGKGKTTGSLGLALRAIGSGLRVHMIQFLKSGATGEVAKSSFVIRQFAEHGDRYTAPAPRAGSFWIRETCLGT